MASDERCEFCAYWRTPVGRGRNICVLRHRVMGAFGGCDRYEPDIPFTDDAVGSDAELRALHEGTAAMGAAE